MNGYIMVDLMPDEGVVPRVLETIDEAGLTLYGLRLTPCSNRERTTLWVDIGSFASGAWLRSLEKRIGSVEGVVEIIHRSSCV